MFNIFLQQNSNDRNLHFLDKCTNKVAPILAKKAYKGSRFIDPLIPNLGAQWR